MVPGIPLIIIQETLDGKVHTVYQEKLQLADNNFYWYYTPEYTDDLKTTDDGSGSKTNHWFGIGIDSQ